MNKSNNIIKTVFVAILAFSVIFPYANPVFAVSSVDGVGGGTNSISGSGGGGSSSVESPLPVSIFSGVSSANAVNLSWKTPNQNDLSEFDLRYSTSPINENNFYFVSRLAGVPQPQPGASQSFNVGNLDTNTTYYFAIKTMNIVGQASPAVFVSVRTGSGGGINTVLPVSIFSGVSSANAVNLSWKTPNQNDLSEFDLRYSTSPINENNFYFVSRLAGVPQPQPGASQSFNVGNLDTNTTYYFAIKTMNIVGQASPAVFVSVRTGSGGGNGGSGGGGGGGGWNLNSPTGNFTINNGEECPANINVTLNISAINAAQMMISNYSDFSGAAWQPFTDKKSWTLLSGTGKKTVYMKFRNSFHIESSSISVSVCAPVPVVTTNNNNNPQVIIVREFQPVRSVSGGQVLGASVERIDFNDLMVNWGPVSRSNKTDLNNDGVVDNRDVEVLAKNWVDIGINSTPALLSTQLGITPHTKNLVEGDSVIFVVMAKPERQNERDFTAQIKMKYPSDLMEFDSFTYAKGWVPVVRPQYDENNVVDGLITKTAGFAEGFSEPKMIGFAKFNIKKEGKGTIVFNENSFILDREHQNSLAGTKLPKEIALNILPAMGENASMMANLKAVFSGESSLGFILLVVFLALLIGLYFLLKQNEKAEKPIKFVKMNVKDEIFKATS